MKPSMCAIIILLGCSAAWSAADRRSPAPSPPPSARRPAHPAAARTSEQDYPEARSADYSLVRAFLRVTWKSTHVPDDVVASANKPRVDGRLGAWTLDAGPHLRRGVPVPYEVGPDEVYRDRHGVRLIVQQNPWYAEFILSSVCKHAAARVSRDLRGLRTESGVGLGDTRKRVLKLLGPPSRQDPFQGHVILWYLRKPRHVVPKDGGPYDEGHMAAYVLKKDKVVEIWLHEWDTQVGG